MTPTEDRSIIIALRLEGGAAFIVATAAYAALAEGWWLYAITALLPDVSAAGYLAGPRVGARAYNIAHSYVTPFFFGLIAWLSAPALLPVAAVWVAHIGIDRLLGYGLKSEQGFKFTHLGRIGRERFEDGRE